VIAVTIAMITMIAPLSIIGDRMNRWIVRSVKGLILSTMVRMDLLLP
jgi:hypothetical protein